MTKSTPKSFRSISTAAFVGPLGVYRLITSTIGPKALPKLTELGRIDREWATIAADHARRRIS